MKKLILMMFISSGLFGNTCVSYMEDGNIELENIIRNLEISNTKVRRAFKNYEKLVEKQLIYCDKSFHNQIIKQHTSMKNSLQSVGIIEYEKKHLKKIDKKELDTSKCLQQLDILKKILTSMSKYKNQYNLPAYQKEARKIIDLKQPFRKYCPKSTADGMIRETDNFAKSVDWL